MDLEGLTILFSLSSDIHILPTMDKLQTLEHDMNRIYANFADNISKHSAGCRLANFRNLQDISQFKREKKLPKTIKWFVGTEATFRASVELAGNAFLEAKTVLDEVGDWGVENGLWEEVRGEPSGRSIQYLLIRAMSNSKMFQDLIDTKKRQGWPSPKTKRNACSNSTRPSEPCC